MRRSHEPFLSSEKQIKENAELRPLDKEEVYRMRASATLPRLPSLPPFFVHPGKPIKLVVQYGKHPRFLNAHYLLGPFLHRYKRDRAIILN
jgi:hypothetical protein